MQEADYKDIKLFQENKDQKAFERIYNRWADATKNILRERWIDDYQLLDDFNQEVWLRVYQKLHTFKFQCSFFTWLYRITKNTAVNHGMRLTRQGKFEQITDSLVDSRPNSAIRENEEAILELCISRAYKRMTPSIRRAWDCQQQGLTYEEMMEATGLSYKTCREHTYVANKFVRKEILRYVECDEPEV